MIITLDEAKALDPNATQGQLEAYEVSIRRLTNNNFQVTSARVKGVRLDITPSEIATVLIRPLQGALPFTAKVGDTLEVNYTGVNDGLFVVNEIMPHDALMCIGNFRGANEEYPDGILTLVEYPADIKEGVRGLIRWNKEFGSKKGIKSETVARWSTTYNDINSSDNLDGYPASEMAFINKYRKVRWS